MENEHVRAQEAHKAKAREEKQEIVTQKLMEEVKSVSVFYLPRIKIKELNKTFLRGTLQATR